MRALILTGEGFEDLELFYPYYRLKEENIQVDITAPLPKPRGIKGFEIERDLPLEKVKPEDYDFLVLPGGKAPQNLRENPEALRIARHYLEAGKPVAAICHGIQTLVATGLLTGRKATCWPGIANELKEANINYLDQEAVKDRNLITSRYPDDLPAFMKTLLELLKHS